MVLIEEFWNDFAMMIIIEVLIVKIIYPRNILYYSLVNYLKKIHILHISLKLIRVFSRISILPQPLEIPTERNCVSRRLFQILLLLWIRVSLIDNMCCRINMVLRLDWHFLTIATLQRYNYLFRKHLNVQ